MLDYEKRAVWCSTKGGKTYMVEVMEHSHYESVKGRDKSQEQGVKSHRETCPCIAQLTYY